MVVLLFYLFYFWLQGFVNLLDIIWVIYGDGFVVLEFCLAQYFWQSCFLAFFAYDEEDSVRIMLFYPESYCVCKAFYSFFGWCCACADRND